MAAAWLPNTAHPEHSKSEHATKIKSIIVTDPAGAAAVVRTAVHLAFYSDICTVVAGGLFFSSLASDAVKTESLNAKLGIAQSRRGNQWGCP